MSNSQIIIQPNGKYCVFSNTTDTIIHYNMSKNDIIEELVNDYRAEIYKK